MIGQHADLTSWPRGCQTKRHQIRGRDFYSTIAVGVKEQTAPVAGRPKNN
jgi:hypothetical protein